MEEVGSPGAHVEKTKFLRLRIGRILTQTEIFLCECPALVGQVGVGPHDQRIGSRQHFGMLAARRESGDGNASRSHHAHGPRGELERKQSAIIDSMCHRHVASFRSQSDLDLLLQAGQWLDRFPSY